MAEDTLDFSSRQSRKRAALGKLMVKEEVKARIKLVTVALKKEDLTRTSEEREMLDHCPDIVDEVRKRMAKRDKLKERNIEACEAVPSEYEAHKNAIDSDEEVILKCHQLAELINSSKNIVVYTGAGISTAAKIPDYRGPNGIWTLLRQGKEIGNHDLTEAEPTLTHMAISALHSVGRVTHVVSQNCDGLHLRSGLPKKALSEVHGNMYIEVCRNCKPAREFIRLFDVTERTALHKHRTGRQCYYCQSDLADTIVHFGEKGTLKWPLNWNGASKAVKKADLILCLGTSLKVLRKYQCLWSMDKPPPARPKLCIVNLQWTPKDNTAAVKINAKCDDVMRRVMDLLNLKIPPYDLTTDVLFTLATALELQELQSTSRRFLTYTQPEAEPLRVETHPEPEDHKPRSPFAHRRNNSPKRVREYTVLEVNAPKHILLDHCYAQKMTVENEYPVYDIPLAVDAKPDIKPDLLETVEAMLSLSNGYVFSSSESSGTISSESGYNSTSPQHEEAPGRQRVSSLSEFEPCNGRAEAAMTSAPGWYGKGFKKVCKKRRTN